MVLKQLVWVSTCVAQSEFKEVRGTHFHMTKQYFILFIFTPAVQCAYWSCLDLYGISASENPEAGHFSEIWPSPAPAKFLAGFAGFARR